jgi:hypothetical protein
MNLTLPKIESGIPIPKKRLRTPFWSNTVAALKPGNSFKVDTDQARIAVMHAASRQGIEVTTRKLNGEGYRIWRIK